MSLFSSILEKLGFGSHAQTAPTPPPSPGTAAAEAAPPPTAISQVDVVSRLEEKARAHEERLDWRSSIVDLLKLLDLDSSLAARKTLAAELGYKGSTEDSAVMNQWLHRTVMERLAENGGNVPNDLRA